MVCFAIVAFLDPALSKLQVVAFLRNSRNLFGLVGFYCNVATVQTLLWTTVVANIIPQELKRAKKI